MIIIENSNYQMCGNTTRKNPGNLMVLIQNIRSRVLLSIRRYGSFLSNIIRNIVTIPYYLACNVISGFKYHVSQIKKKFLEKNNYRKDVLYAFYDLDVMSASFDIVPFLVFAEKIRISKGLKSLHVIIVPGTCQGFAKGYFEYYQNMTPDKTKVQFSYLQWRVRNILIPCCWLIPSCSQITACASRNEAQSTEDLFAEHIYPDRYLVSVPLNPNKNIYQMGVTQENPVIPSITASPSACDFVKKWIDMTCEGKKVVTITLRETTYEVERNSNISEWVKFAHSLDKNYYFPVLIRDTEMALHPPPTEMRGLTFFNEACWNLELRAALYQVSYLNLFVNGGPMILSWFNTKSRFLIFKLITNSVDIATGKNLEYIGISVGEQPLYFSPFQRLVWSDDNYNVIKLEFEKMCKTIDTSSGQNP